jgi:Calx-beta domain-containing protein
LMNGINPNEPANFYVPFVMDPSNSSRLVLGTNRVYETTDRADHWSPISAPNANGWNSSQPISALGLPFGDPNTIYAITKDAHLFVTTDHGNSWHQRDIPGFSPYFIAPSIFGPSPIAGIVVDPANDAVAYVVVDQFSGGPGRHVFRTSDFGRHWTDISGNLPDTPTSAIVLDSRTNVLYVGTDIGVYASNNGGATWARFQTGMPNVRVVDLELSPALNILAAGTHGRGMWEISVPTPGSLSPSVAGLTSVQIGAPTLVSPILSAAMGQGAGTIVDDQPSISISDVMTREGRNGTTLFTFTVTLSAAYDQPMTLSYKTTDGTATTSDQDYVAKTGTLTFAPGETTKTITITVNGDSKKEANETFYLDLFGNSSNSLFTKSRGIGTTLNDD